MNGANRRDFIKIAGVGAAAIGVTAGVSGVASASSVPAAAISHTLPAGAQGSMVAYINDVSKGEVSVMVEGREVTVIDHQMVAKLATLIHRAGTARAI